MNGFTTIVRAYFTSRQTSRSKACFEKLAELLDAQLDPALVDQNDPPAIHVNRQWGRELIQRELHFIYRGWDFVVIARPGTCHVVRYNQALTDHRYIINTLSAMEDVVAWILKHSCIGAEPATYDESQSSESDSSRDISD